MNNNYIKYHLATLRLTILLLKKIDLDNMLIIDYISLTHNLPQKGINMRKEMDNYIDEAEEKYTDLLDMVEKENEC